MTHSLQSLALFTLGFGEIVLLLGVVMLLFGAKKLPMLARGLGAGIRNFKGELSPPGEDEDAPD